MSCGMTEPALKHCNVDVSCGTEDPDHSRSAREPLVNKYEVISFAACLLCSGGNIKAGAPVMCLFPCFNCSGSLLACTDCTDHDVVDGLSTYASGVDSTNGIFTHDTKFHAIHVDLYFDVCSGPADVIVVCCSYAAPFDSPVLEPIVEESVLSKKASVSDFCL